jgi:hypothetical protein
MRQLNGAATHFITAAVAQVWPTHCRNGCSCKLAVNDCTSCKAYAPCGRYHAATLLCIMHTQTARNACSAHPYCTATSCAWHAASPVLCSCRSLCFCCCSVLYIITTNILDWSHVHAHASALHVGASNSSSSRSPKHAASPASTTLLAPFAVGKLQEHKKCLLNFVNGDLNLPLQPSSALVGGGVGCRLLSALPADELLHGCALLKDNEQPNVHFHKPAASCVA